MKVIFLDIDGVLNCQSSEARCGAYIGIDSDKVKRLRKIVDATDAAIILSSSWRLGYNKDFHSLENHIKYLSNKLGKQHLRVVGSTPSLKNNRGHEIQEWLKKNDDIVTEWVVLDDEYFNDFDECNITPHLVTTCFYDDNGGLQDEHVEQAIKILNGELNEKGGKKEKEREAS